LPHPAVSLCKQEVTGSIPVGSITRAQFAGLFVADAARRFVIDSAGARRALIVLSFGRDAGECAYQRSEEGNRKCESTRPFPEAGDCGDLVALERKHEQPRGAPDGRVSVLDVLAKRRLRYSRASALGERLAQGAR
jgi:hypothetical protein